MTRIYMERWRLITKKAMVKYCKGEKDRKISVNDDLESLFEDLQLGKEPDKYEHLTYFLPKLTEKEMKSVERKDTTFLQSFYLSHPDVEEVEMNRSESDSKSDSKSDLEFVGGYGWRRTFTIKNSSAQKIHCSLQ